VPSISVILPNYNHGTELHTSLLAAATQTLPADEIIVIDDASTDSSIAIIEGFAERFPNIRLLRNAERRGVSTTVSRGLAEARGDYVVMASADEKMLPTMIERLSAAADCFPAARMIVSSYTQWWPERDDIQVHGPDSELGPWFLSSPEPAYLSPERLHELLKRSFVWLGINTAMFARAALVEVGGYDPALRWHSDWFASYAIAFKYGVVVVPESLALFREAEGSYSAVGMRDRRQQQAVVLAIQRKLKDPRFAYFYHAIKRSPMAMSPFMRPTLRALITQPSMYSMMLAVVPWWLRQVMRGRRPAAWARLLHRGRLPGPNIVRPAGERANWTSE
jgi:glycosyltransferase involved in cell wall biosynthesis